MDTATQAAVEKQLAMELFGNERLVDRKDFDGTPGTLVFKRQTLRDEGLIGEARRKSYQSDMKNPDILSKSELSRMASARGMWDETIPSQIKELMERTTTLMGALEASGFQSVDEITDELSRVETDLLAEYQEETELAAEVRAAITRLATDTDLNYDDQRLVEVNATGTKVFDLIEEIKLLRNQIDALSQFAEARKALNALQAKQTELFVDSMESRAEREQELATIFYCCLNGDTGKPIWPSIDDMKQADPMKITFLINEYSYFINGVTTEFQEMLTKYGFLQRLSDTKSGSDDSPVQPESNPDGAATVSEEISSLLVLDMDLSAMTSLPVDSSTGSASTTIS